MNGSYVDARNCPLCTPNVKVVRRFAFGYGPVPTEQTFTTESSSESGIFSHVINPTIKDALFSYWASAQEYRNDCSCSLGSPINGSQITVKTWADTATFNSPTNGTPTQESCPNVAVTWNPKTNESVAEIRAQYKRTVDSVWIDGPIISQGEQGNFNRSASTTLTGLLAGTAYNYRFRVERTTENERVAFSGTGTFTTNPHQTVTTNAASSITGTGATLNGNVNPQHANNSVTYRFEWGLTTNYGNLTTLQGPSSGTSGIPYTQVLTGLVQDTLYNYRAIAISSEETVVGSNQSFTTSVAAPTHTKSITDTATPTDAFSATQVEVHDPLYFGERLHQDLIFNEEQVE